MSKLDRAAGFYWVRRTKQGQWVVAEWEATEFHSEFHWYIPGLVASFHDGSFAEIDERRIERQPPPNELRKGMRVRVEWLDAAPIGSASLAGVQAKTAAVLKSAEGVVRRIRGDHPVNPTSVGVWIVTDAGEEVIADAKHIVAMDDGDGTTPGA